MQTTTEQITRMIGRLLLVSSILTAGAGAQAGNTPLTEAQAQALILRIQTQPGVPLSTAEGLNLSNYLVARNAQLAATAASQIQGTAPAITQASVSLPPARTAANPLGSTGAKKPGVTRIGVVLTKADFGQGGGPSAGESVRALMEQYLNGPKLEILSLAAMLPQQADAEAKDKGCDYVMYSSITQKKAAGGFGLLRGGSSMLNMIPMVGMASGVAGVMAATTVASAASASASIAGQVKAKSDITFEYSLLTPGSATPVLTNKNTAHAKADGEDLITPLIEAAATAVVSKMSTLQPG